MPDVERLVWSPPAYGVIAIGDVIVQLWERDAPASAFRALLAHLENGSARTPTERSG